MFLDNLHIGITVGKERGLAEKTFGLAVSGRHATDYTFCVHGYCVVY